MVARKQFVESRVLGRRAHTDVFELGGEPRFLFVLFGGSGVDEEEYEQRGRSVVPALGELPGDLEREGVRAWIVHVTAPYDVPFSRFSTGRASASAWNAHVSSELLGAWPELPFFVSGFSGGSALALNGLQDDPRCFGGAALGWDAVPPDFARPAHWSSKLRLYSAPQDRVCNAPENRRVAEALERRGEAEVVRLRTGGHRLADYASSDGLGDLIRHADRLAP